MNIVLSAFACDPGLPSEPTVGWDYLCVWIRIVETQPDLHLTALMNERSKAASLTRLRELNVDLSRVTIVGLPNPVALSLLLRPSLTRVEYLVWNLQARRYLRRRSRSNQVLMARHVTFATEILPTPISVVPENAFRVWGPLGASGNVGAVLARPRSRGWAQQSALQWLRDRIAPLIARRIARTVDLTLAANEAFRDDLSAHGLPAQLFQNVRQDETLLALIDRAARPRRQQVKRGGLQLLAVGHLIPRKRFELAIAALADSRLRHAQLVVIGSAPPELENNLLHLARSMGVAERVRFDGQLSREEVVAAMVQADVLVHPAAREGAPGVVGEATSVGLPVVVFAETGSAAVLELSGASGVRVDPRRWRSNSLIADAVLEASALPRVRSSAWSADRYELKERELLATARKRLDACGPELP